MGGLEDESILIALTQAIQEDLMISRMSGVGVFVPRLLRLTQKLRSHFLFQKPFTAYRSD
jgi:hypothetical protein